MFQLNQFIANYSYGPASVMISQIGNERYAKIIPYNYYCVYRDKTIYILLPATYAVDVKCDNDRTVAMQISRDGIKKVCVSTSIQKITNALNDNAVKVTLFTNVATYTIETLINKCLERGVFSL